MPTAHPRLPALPRQARLFIAAVAACAAGAVVAAQTSTAQEVDVAVLTVCLVLCAAGSFSPVRAPAGYYLRPQLPAIVFAALTLPPAAAAAVAVSAFLPGAIRRREDLFHAVFDGAALALAGAVAFALGRAVGADGTRADVTLGMFVGTIALVAVNHALLSAARSLAAGERPRHAVLAAARMEATFGLALAIDLALALTGASVAALWMTYPEALPLAVGPVTLACAALWIPVLRHASRTDAKTGLFNYSHVRHLMSVAVASAQRSRRPASVIMVDLDHLRAVNNRHGHLVGDELIAAVAGVLTELTEGRGSAGRFGGEEFCAVLPGLDSGATREIAEEIRRRVAERHTVDGDDLPAISVSIGVASCPEHGDDVDAVLHAADMALYDAKLGGRDRVRVAPPRESTVLPFTVEPRRPATHPPAPAEPVPAPAAAPAAHSDRARWIPPFAALLILGTGLIAVLADHSAVVAEPLVFSGLLVAVLILDAVRIDLFERLQTSPAALPVLALAALFGPLGPVVGEGLIVLTRIARKVPALKWSFDFGALALSGIAAAIAFAALHDAGVHAIPSGVAAGVAYYAVNIPLVALVIGLARGTSPLANFREQLAWLLPHYLGFGALAGLFVTGWERSGFTVFALFGVPTLMLWLGEQQYLARSRSGVEELRRSHAELEQANADLRRLLSDNQALVARLQAAYLSTITSLARTIEAKDPYTGGHTDRVSRVSGALAAEMGFTADELQAVEVGAAIHDIGKIGVPDATLLKPGPLTPDERRVIEQHPEISSYIVAELDVPAIVKQMVRNHHERYDGTGYPDRLAGEEIPLSARILTVADALDAMTSDRPYRSALSTAQALEAIDEATGSQFCPQVVAALHRCLNSDQNQIQPRPLEAVV